MKRTLSAALLALAASLIAIAPGAAAQEMEFKIGSECAANNGVPDFTLIPREINQGNVERITVPLDGVLTQWKVHFAPLEGTGSYPETLKVMKGVEGYEGPEVQVVAESAPEAVVPGVNTFKARIPVKAGEFFGIWGGTATPTLYCERAGEGERTSYSATQGDLAVGTRSIFNEGPAETQVPILATVEADVDGDGYGDVSQDKCPESARYHGPCPQVSFAATARGASRSVLVKLRLSSEATVGVYGAVRWQRPSDGRHMSAGLGGGTPQKLQPGVHRFSLALPNEVVKTLSRLKPAHSLPVRITIRVTDLAGRVKKQVLRLRIPGRA